jgi:hypothetical protein
VTSVFKSSARRFTPHQNSSEANVPGPAQYTLGSTLGKKMKNFSKKRTSALDFMPPRAQSPPSIPTKDQSHGYEVTPQGSVIPQPPIIPSYTGRGQDTVGPADYDPRIDVKFKSAPKTSFKGPERDQLDKIQARIAETPGPGYYNTPSAFDGYPTGNGLNDSSDFLIAMHQAKQRQLSSFESKTARDVIMQEVAKRKHDPGPGQYMIPSTIDSEKMTKPPNLQFFASSEPRFKSQQARSMQLETAPGKYNVISSDFDQLRLKILKQKKMASRSDWAQNIAFTSTTKRFQNMEENHIYETPTPTAYYPKVGLAETLSRPNIRSGAFGSKDIRFKESKNHYYDTRLTKEQQIEQELNRELQAFLAKNQKPTTNNTNDSSHRSMTAPKSSTSYSPTGSPTRPRFTSAFGPSPDHRLRPIKTPPGPPPGAYDTAPKWIKERGVPVIAPNLNLSRKKPEMTPGPGQYTITSSINPQAWRNPKNVLISTTKREDVELKKKAIGPGPGYYNPTPLTGSLIRPSYNVYLSEKYQ